MIMKSNLNDKDTINIICPLCGQKKIKDYYCDKNRNYYQCDNCNLIFVPPDHYLSKKKEKKRYDQHTNNPNDINYRNFLNRIFKPINKQIPKNSLGLDFGCGPGPTLSIMFQEAGHMVNLFDYFYAYNPEVFNYKYDFITTTEVIEHLHNPYHEIKILWNALKNGGLLGIMTGLVTDKESFSKWYYIRDLTHVCFFSKSTLKWLAKDLKANIFFEKADIAILKKV
jgi:predicted RNA-binding Zn-ribbon protein involved in translation (DUF1610 family)